VRLLLDTHTLFWALVEPALLSADARRAIEAPPSDVYVSTASAWEMAIKVGIGKWPEAAALVDQFEERLDPVGFRTLPITVMHARSAGLLRSPHRDPFDRLLIAQATIEDLTLVTADPKLVGLGAEVLW